MENTVVIRWYLNVCGCGTAIPQGQLLKDKLLCSVSLSVFRLSATYTLCYPQQQFNIVKLLYWFSVCVCVPVCEQEHRWTVWTSGWRIARHSAESEFCCCFHKPHGAAGDAESPEKHTCTFADENLLHCCNPCCLGHHGSRKHLIKKEHTESRDASFVAEKTTVCKLK